MCVTVVEYLKNIMVHKFTFYAIETKLHVHSLLQIFYCCEQSIWCKIQIKIRWSTLDRFQWFWFHHFRALNKESFFKNEVVYLLSVGMRICSSEYVQKYFYLFIFSLWAQLHMKKTRVLFFSSNHTASYWHLFTTIASFLPLKRLWRGGKRTAKKYS